MVSASQMQNKPALIRRNPDREDERTNILETIHQTAIWPVTEVLHDVFQGDKVSDVYCRLILKRVRVRRRVEVDKVPRPF